MANLAISDVRTDFPEGVAYALDGDGQLAVCKFNDSRRFNLLAVGCYDGTVRIVDLDCKSFARDLAGHVAPVSSLSWSRNGQFLLSASKDWNCILWDLTDPMSPLSVKDCVLRFGSPVVMASMYTINEEDGNLKDSRISMHESDKTSVNEFRIVVSCLNQYPYIISLTRNKERGGHGGYIEDRAFLVNLDEGDVDLTKSSEFIQTTVVSFDSTGKFIFLGNAKGIVTVVDEASRSVLMHFRPSGTPAIKGFHFSSDGKYVAINSADKTLRCYHMNSVLGLDYSVTEIQSIEPDFKYFDSIDQNRWVQCVYSPDSKYFIGGSAVKNSHKIYIWNTKSCTLEKLLEIQKDSLVDIAWHPRLPILVSISTAGVLNVWTVKVHENWSAFAPDFRELDENVEYVELEDEFDIVEDAQKRSIAISKASQEDEYVDVVGI
ncbi:WD40-repeat-containing domain protein [Obelidium mucronatum]|nr:WD40-repeat-containing domain protein [Obelidium mucronatum]